MKFNLSKYAQEDLTGRDQVVMGPAATGLDSAPVEGDISVGEPESLMRDEDNIEKFLDHAQLRDTLAAMTPDKAVSAFVSKIEDKPMGSTNLSKISKSCPSFCLAGRRLSFP